MCEIVGTIKVINPAQQVSATFKKRELVVVTDQEYPQYISINFINAKADLLDRFAEGQEVKISVNINGRSWTSPQGETKYFNDIQGWKIEAVSNALAAPQPTQQQAGNAPQPENDLPW